MLRIFCVNALGIAGTVAALVPLLGRRRPLGTRRTVPRRAAAPVVPLLPQRAQTW